MSNRQEIRAMRHGKRAEGEAVRRRVVIG